MKMNSPLVDYTKISPNKTSPRNHKIDTITIHCMAGNLSVESCGNLFASPARKASANYGIDSKGRIGLYVDEKDRSWCSSSAANDNRAITIEVANDGGANTGWHISDKAYDALIDLLVDICKRNGIKELKWQGDKSLIGQVDKQNMTVHRWFAAKSCPGDYLYNLHVKIAQEVNSLLNPPKTTAKTTAKTLYRVQVGAFQSKTNADNLAKQLKSKGFDTYIVLINGLYKVQVGAFSVKANADAMLKKLEAAGYNGFITNKNSSSTAPSPALKVGAKVKIVGEKYATGQEIPDYIKNKTYTVQQISGEKVLLKEIVSWVYKKDIKIVG